MLTAQGRLTQADKKRTVIIAETRKPIENMKFKKYPTAKKASALKTTTILYSFEMFCEFT